MLGPYVITDKPLSTGGSSVYEYDESIVKKFTTLTRYDEVIRNYKVIGTDDKPRILVPRGACPISDTDMREIGTPVSFTSKFKARNDEQVRIVGEAKHYLVEEKLSFILEAATGTGKTAMSMDLIAAVGRKVMVVVTKEDLRDRWIEEAQAMLGLKRDEIGLVQGDLCQVAGKKLVIGMIQSLSKTDKYPPNVFKTFGFVIFDECHRVSAEMFSNCIWLFPALLRLGLSATPTRKDGRDSVFRQHIGPVLVKSKQLLMIPKVIRVKTPWKIPMVQRAGKMIPLPHSPGKTMHINKLLAKHKERNQLMADFIETAYQKERSIIFFSDMRNHLERMGHELLKLGVPAKDIAYYVGGITEDEREKAKVKPIILATYAFCKEGTDIPWLDTLVLGTPKSDVVQIIGRILREYPEKKPPVVFDPLDESSVVFRGYANKRMKWYRDIKAQVVQR